MNTLYKSGWILRVAIMGLIIYSAALAISIAGREGGTPVKDKTNRTEAEWKEALSSEQYEVLRQKGTESPGTGKFLKHKDKGTYTCAGCGQELFESDEKYASGCGWPSFYQTSYDDSITEQPDKTAGIVRTEVLCSNCGGHLGHVFNDGPQPTGLRYCINSLSLGFKESAENNKPLQKATFGAGCFWCTEAAFESIKGVKSVTVGYMGGKKKDPTYKEVCSGNTGHAEVSQVTYDPDEVSYDRILEIFWKVHDPTTLNKQGKDIGTQYRSVIFYHSGEQKKAAEESLKEYDVKLKNKIVTEVSAADTFYKAEDYHQNYYENNSEEPYCRLVIKPKLKKIYPSL